MALSRNIRYLRRKQGWGQEDLAEKLGYKSYTTIQKWESGVSEPPLKVVHQLAALFQIDINDLTNLDLEANSSVNTKKPVLTTKDRRDIAKDLEMMMQDLDAGGDLMFDGDPISDEAKASIRNALQMGLEIAKVKNKERFTPKKYRKE